LIAGASVLSVNFFTILYDYIKDDMDTALDDAKSFNDDALDELSRETARLLRTE
jgi:hypothetical protein